jgi:XTP/dITP diphosphohydrolase
MLRLRHGERLVLATHNPGKVREMRALVQPYGIEIISAGDLGLPVPEETETTFIGNARLKAEAAASGSGLAALSDDSGIEVAVLDGAPGVVSADWAGPEKDFSLAMRRVHDSVVASGAKFEDRPRANFTSVLCLARPGEPSQCFEGKVFGHIVWPPRGNNGFGYDPIFVPDGYEQTFGEMDPGLKHRLSHRARSFEKFAAACLD